MTPQSMTGIGLSHLTWSSSQYRLLLKSVNHKHFEFRARLPRSMAPWELKIRKIVLSRFSRGSVDLQVDVSRHNSLEGNPWLQQVQRQLESLRDFPIGLDAKIHLAIKAIEKTGGPESEAPEIPWDSCLKAVTEACDALELSRQTEGAQLMEVLRFQASELKRIHSQILVHLPKLRQEFEANFKARIQRCSESLGGPMPPEERILQELVLVAERRDVAEELERIASHFELLDSYLKPAPEGVPDLGKKLDFVAQELHREWTTLGNKIQDSNAQRWANEARLCVDRIKEQSANMA